MPYSFYIVLICLMFGILYYKKFNNTIYKFFVLYLGFTFAIEFFGGINVFFYKKTNNLLFNSYPLYNGFVIISFLSFFLFYQLLFKNKTNKKILTFFCSVFLGFILVDLTILKTSFVNGFIINIFVMGAILIIASLILFLIEIIKNEKIVFNIKKSFVFWISIGLLLFYIGSTPIMIASKYLEYSGLYQDIITFLNLIMYGCFIIGFIKSDPKYNY